jgi:hypothetical protein
MTLYIPQPLRVCQELYGVQNILDIRDAMCNCFVRFCGMSSEWMDTRVYFELQRQLVQAITDAGRNPRAFRLAVSPDRVMPNPFPKYLFECNGDKETAYNKATEEVLTTFPPDMVKQALLHIYIDYHSC